MRSFDPNSKVTTQRHFNRKLSPCELCGKCTTQVFSILEDYNYVGRAVICTNCSSTFKKTLPKVKRPQWRSLVRSTKAKAEASNFVGNRTNGRHYRLR